ncbi:TadE/TadG family type IV pilus assembly protein [Roseateles sp.]|uniref:TadE/TadG family type IV pilus assembly protein n=1 Tax=Roseateles sp. TaxID=1971397 RepID=UPI003BA98FD4
MRRPGRRLWKQGGQSATEFLVVFPMLIFLVLGVIQWGLLYQARAVLNHASLLTARAGAVHNGNKGEMKKALAAGLTPLFASEASMTGFATARAKAFTEISVANLASIDVLNPTAQAFSDFGQVRLDGAAGGDREIPNDTLNFRNPTPGTASGISVQDANILHVRVSYCYRLIVPVVGRMIHAAVNALPLSHTLQANGMSDPFSVGDGPLVDSCTRPLVSGPRIRIQSEAVVRMQSPFYRSNL